jgi:hypothetical protein
LSEVPHAAPGLGFDWMSYQKVHCLCSLCGPFASAAPAPSVGAATSGVVAGAGTAASTSAMSNEEPPPPLSKRFLGVGERMRDRDRQKQPKRREGKGFGLRGLNCLDVRL